MRRLAIALTLSLAAGAAHAQSFPDSASRLAAQAEAMKPLAWMDGVWRGQAWSVSQAGRHEVTQTERIGPFLSGSVKVMEGRGYGADGKVSFNAFGTVSYDPGAKTYVLHSNAQGYAGDFPLQVTPDGYVWTTPAGPGRSIRYTATMKQGAWREVGEMVAEGRPPVQIFEMNLTRVGATDWPAGGAVSMR